MWAKRAISMILIFVLMLGTAPLSVNATVITDSVNESLVTNFVTPRATGSFSITIPAKSLTQADGKFSLMTGETVTIKASYAPFSANVDFGLIGPDGTYRYFTITNGSIDKTILIEESGNYTLLIRNNSNFEVEVTGFVNY